MKGLWSFKKTGNHRYFSLFLQQLKQFTAMKELLEGIAYLFEEILFAPFNWLRELELENWWLANLVSWLAIIILIVALGYWMKQLRIFEKNDEEDKSQTAHSFLK
jgi:uncharacterized membrane protein